MPDFARFYQWPVFMPAFMRPPNEITIGIELVRRANRRLSHPAKRIIPMLARFIATGRAFAKIGRSKPPATDS